MQWPPRPGARVEGHEAERLGGRGLDHLPDVHVQAVAHERDLVDEADVHAAEGVLEQLHHLRGLGGGDGDDVVDGACVEGARHPGAGRGHAADDLGGVARVVLRVAGIDALGREGEEERLPHRHALPAQDGEDELFRRAGIGGALEDDELARAEAVADGLGRVHHHREVGVLGLAERRGHADDHGVALAQQRRSRCWRRSRPSPTSALTRAEGTSLMYDSPRLTAATFSAERSKPVTRSPPLANSTERGRPT